MSATFHLYRLQQVDSQIDKVEKRLDEIQRIIDDNRELKRAKIGVKKEEEAHKKTAVALKKAENNVKAQHIQIEQTEAMLYGGSIINPKEVQDLQNKAESLKRHLSTAHDLKPGQYRKQFGIASGTPLVAKNYSEARKKMALDLNLAEGLARARAARSKKKKR